ncbi:MAG: N-acetyl-gamma-glutamyl-phosphate reductase [bacterium]
MSESSLRVAVVGASGYTGEELLKICLRHPAIQLTALTSRQLEGVRLGEFLGISGKGAELAFENLSPEEVAKRADVFFLSLPHKVSSEFVVPLMEAGKTVFDLSADFRLKDVSRYAEFYDFDHPAPDLLDKAVYGLPELYAKEIAAAQLIACPGCYPTSIILPLAPLLRERLIDGHRLVINSLSGVSGAGKNAAYLFCECNENLRAYSVPQHRHLPEMEQELSALAGSPLKVSFTPHMVPVTRGMLTTISAPFIGENMKEIRAAYDSFYAGRKFIRVLSDDQLPETRRVMHTNFAEIAFRWDSRTSRLVLICAIDNLGKGAAGQAVQAFNTRFGFSEDAGL